MNIRTVLALTIAMAAGVAASAQDVQSKSITIGVGTAAPDDKQYMDSDLALELNLGVRYNRYLQFDAGFETSFNRDHRNLIPRTGSGDTTSTNFFVPVGGRIIIPLLRGRLEPSFGVGGVYRYDKNGFDQNQGGAYGLGGVSYALDYEHRHRVGFTVRYINIMSTGRPHPQWVNVFGEYTYTWGAF